MYNESTSFGAFRFEDQFTLLAAHIGPNTEKRQMDMCAWEFSIHRNSNGQTYWSVFILVCNIGPTDQLYIQ